MPKSQTICRSLAAALLLGTSLSFALAGDDPAGKQREAERIKNDNEQLARQESNCKAMLETASPEVKKAGEAVIAAIEAKITANTKLATAIAGTDEKAVHDARDEASKAGDQCRRQMDRFEVRRMLAKLASMEPTITGNAETQKLVDALKAEIVKAKEVGEGYLATSNDKPWPEIDALRDSWIEAQENVDIAQRALTYANDRSKMTAKLDFSDPDVKAKLAALMKLEDDAIAAYRLSKEKARLANQLDRKRQLQMRELLSTPTKPAEKPVKKQ